MLGFYIINKEKMDVLFCRPLSLKKDETAADNIVKLLLSLYSKIDESDSLEELQVLKLKNTKIIFMNKYSFLFLLLSPPNYSTEMVSSQLFFFMKLFLNAFEIKDEKSAFEFLNEIESIKRREISESLSHSFMLWNVLDLHIEDIDKRNIVEVYENILNSIWLGLRMFIIEKMSAEVEATIISYIKNFEEYINKKTFYLKGAYTLTEEEGFDLCKVDIQQGTTTEMKREFLSFLKHIVENLRDTIGLDGLRHVIAYKLPNTLKIEWGRLLGLELVQDVLAIVWR